MNPYTLAIEIFWPALFIVAVIMWVGAAMTADEADDPDSDVTRDDVRAMITIALIPTALFLIAFVTLPFLANNWDCDNATHPGDRPCEVHGER